MTDLPHHRNRNRHRIWRAARPDLRLGDAEDMTLVVSRHLARPTAMNKHLYVLEVLPGRGDQVLVRYGKLGEGRAPAQVEVPRSRRLDDFTLQFWDTVPTRAIFAPGVQWAPGLPPQVVAMIGALFVLGCLAAVLLSDRFGAFIWLLPAFLAVFSLYHLLRVRHVTAIHRRGNKRPYQHGQVLMRLAEVRPSEPDDALAIGTVAAPADRQQAEARVAELKAIYGALLTDLAYRIENSALFDPAVELTREFTVLLARWDDEHHRLSPDDAAALARDLHLAFDAARAHAEAVGVEHLPATARKDANRAVKAVRLARRASTVGERAAAIERVNDILATLALYYLPDRAEATRVLAGERRVLDR